MLKAYRLELVGFEFSLAERYKVSEAAADPSLSVQKGIRHEPLGGLL